MDLFWFALFVFSPDLYIYLIRDYRSIQVIVSEIGFAKYPKCSLQLKINLFLLILHQPAIRPCHA